MLKKIFKYFINVLTGILILILIIAIYGKVEMMINNRNYPVYFGYTFFQVASGSMEPTIYIDDVILVNTKDHNIKKDDIISYNKDGNIITHRVLFVDGDNITVKGDNNNAVDRPITKEDVIGKVTKVFPKLKIWKEVFTDYKVLIILFVTLILFDLAISYDPNKKNVSKTKESKIKPPKIECINDIKEEKKNVDKINNDEILDITRKIDISEINELLDNETKFKLSDKEIKNLKDKLENTIELPKLKPKEQKFIEYTIRLDLKQIKQNINKKVK